MDGRPRLPPRLMTRSGGKAGSKSRNATSPRLDARQSVMLSRALPGRQMQFDGLSDANSSPFLGARRSHGRRRTRSRWRCRWLTLSDYGAVCELVHSPRGECSAKVPALARNSSALAWRARRREFITFLSRRSFGPDAQKPCRSRLQACGNIQSRLNVDALRLKAAQSQEHRT